MLHKIRLNKSHYSNTLIALILFFFTFSFVADAQSQETNRAEVFNLKNGVALNSHDPVSYFTNEKPEKGKASISTEYKGVIYNFASEQNREQFLEDPEKYEPLYGGYCAYSMLDGDIVNVNHKNYKITDGKLLLFNSMMFGLINARKSWNKEAEDTDGGEQELMSRAHEHWKTIEN